MLRYQASHPRGLGAVRQARRGLIDFAAACGFRGSVLADIENAVGEALANAAEHGNHGGSAGFDVNATFADACLVIEVQDRGAGFDCATAVKDATADAFGNRGFGIFLMRTLMDEVAYTERGSCIQLVKRLGEGPFQSAP